MIRTFSWASRVAHSPPSKNLLQRLYTLYDTSRPTLASTRNSINGINCTKFEFLREERKCKGLFASSPLRARSVNPRSRRPPNSSCSPYTRTTTMSLKPSSRHRAIGLYKEVRPPAVPEQRKGRNWCLLADACFILSHPFLPSLTVTAAATRTGLVGPAELSLPHDTG